MMRPNIFNCLISFEQYVITINHANSSQWRCTWNQWNNFLVILLSTFKTMYANIPGQFQSEIRTAYTQSQYESCFFNYNATWSWLIVNATHGLHKSYSMFAPIEMDALHKHSDGTQNITCIAQIHTPEWTSTPLENRASCKRGACFNGHWVTTSMLLLLLSRPRQRGAEENPKWKNVSNLINICPTFKL